MENTNQNLYYTFFLLVPQKFPISIKNIILELNNKYECKINFIYVKKLFQNLLMKISHITLPTYYHLLIGDLLPKNIDKCIYLDVDICVRKDLSELFNINMKDNYIAGVLSPSFYFNQKKHCSRLNLPSMNQYINVGILLIDLRQIRKENMTEKFIEL